MIIGNIAIIRGKQISRINADDKNLEIKILFNDKKDYNYTKVKLSNYRYYMPTFYKFCKGLDNKLTNLLKRWGLKKYDLIEAREIIKAEDHCKYYDICEFTIPTDNRKIDINDLIKSNKA